MEDGKTTVNQYATLRDAPELEIEKVFAISII